MSAELRTLESAIADFDRQADDDFVDPRRLSAAIDRLQGKLCRVVSAARKRGDHLVAGQSACTWVAVQCQMSKTTAADRLCVGEQLGNLPRIAEALGSGQIGYQAAAVICHLSELVGVASQLGNGMPISSKTVQRLACDGTLHRVIKADSVVVDVGRATRSVSASQWRALKARHRTCAAPECDRPINMTSPHHIEFWTRGGKSDLPNLLPLCYHHHRLVHEGGWQVIRAGQGVKFIAPERVFTRRRRWGEQRRAA